MLLDLANSLNCSYLSVLLSFPCKFRVVSGLQDKYALIHRFQPTNTLHRIPRRLTAVKYSRTTTVSVLTA